MTFFTTNCYQSIVELLYPIYIFAFLAPDSKLRRCHSMTKHRKNNSFPGTKILVDEKWEWKKSFLFFIYLFHPTNDPSLFSRWIVVNHSIYKKIVTFGFDSTMKKHCTWDFPRCLTAEMPKKRRKKRGKWKIFQKELCKEVIECLFSPRFFFSSVIQVFALDLFRCNILYGEFYEYYTSFCPNFFLTI